MQHFVLTDIEIGKIAVTGYEKFALDLRIQKAVHKNGGSNGYHV